MNKQKAKTIVNTLSGKFIDKPALNFSSEYELLVAVILSAQCTDERVNKIIIRDKDFDRTPAMKKIRIKR